jgi:hypothetical protein
MTLSPEPVPLVPLGDEELVPPFELFEPFELFVLPAVPDELSSLLELLEHE